MKHSSLLERAAEVYDFSAALRASRPEPVREAPAPVAAVTEPVAAAAPAPRILEAPRPKAAPRQVRDGAVHALDRGSLAEGGYILPEAPAGPVAEEFRIIKRQLLADMDRLRAGSTEQRRTVLVTSAQPEEGKSWCALNLALSLASERDRDVLLIDGDVVKPDILPRAGLDAGLPGLVDALVDPDSDPEAFVLATDVERLSLLPAGARVGNVPELLNSGRLRQVLEQLASDPRRILLFDSPPVLHASHAAILSAYVGQVLMVVRADSTTEADLREAVTLLSACDQVGLVLNAAGMSAGGRRFGSYRGYDHGE